MSERFQELFRLPSSLYSGNCPVLIEVGVLQKDNKTNKVFAQIKLRNLGKKTINAVKISINAYESNGNAVEGVPSHPYLDMNIGTGQEFGSKVPVFMPDNKTRRIEVSVIEIVFSDDLVWNADPCDWKKVPAQETIAERLPDIEMQKQYELEVGKDCNFVPVMGGGLFQCTCGSVNLDSAERCYKCGRRYESLVTYLDENTLEQKKDERLEREKKEREARIQKEREEREAKEKAATEAAEAERIAKEKAKQKRKIIIKNVIKFTVIFFVIGSTLSFLLVKKIIPMVKYNAAMKLYEAGKYDEAYTAFSELVYKDSSEMAVKSKYSLATELFNKENYNEAYRLFSELKYNDSSEKAEECRYYLQLNTLENISIGSVVKFGYYEQDNNKENGKEEIEWLVLSIEDGSALLISKYALDCHIYNDTNDFTTWEECSLRRWLNETFYTDAFDERHQKDIILSSLEMDKTLSFRTPAGNKTDDKIFVLSIKEANKYFKSDSNRECDGTEYCYAQGASGGEKTYGVCWWLRTPADYHTYSSAVDLDGKVASLSDVQASYYKIDFSLWAVRPAMRISLD